MGVPAPVNDYPSLVELTGRIHKFIAAHPGDKEALADLHYVVGLMQGGATQAANTQEMTDATGPVSQHPGADIRAGLTQAALDLPKGILGAVTHPIQALGQITGLGNIGSAIRTFRDPEANWAEKTDAILRATPANVGYAAERGLLDATGVKSDTPASVTDQAHAAGNVASLALLGVNRNTPGVGAAGRLVGKIPVVGPLLRAGQEALKRPAAPVGLLVPEATSAADAMRAQLLKAGVLPENVDAQMARQTAPQGLLTSEPPEVPAYRRSGAPMPEPRPSRMAKGQPGAALPPSWQGTTPEAGGVGGHSYSGTWPKEISVANVAKAAAAVRGLSIADLQRVWQTPNIPGALRQMVEAEFQRRMVTIPDLGIRPSPGLLSPH